MGTQPELILDAQATLGEGPCWQARGQQLFWVDILQKQLHIYRPDDKTNRTIQLGYLIGCVSPRQQGGVILGLEHGFATLDLGERSPDPAR